MALLHALPQQTLWALQASQNASARERQSKAKGLVDEAMAKAGGKALPRLVDAARKLGEALIELCNAHVPPKSKHMSLARDCRRLLAARGEALILPLQSSLTPCLPPADQPPATHTPFGTLPCFHKFRDDVEVLNSLQRPRKLTVTASDGREYIFLCKPKDDLRRDARMMEFNTLVNKLMGEAAEARRRALCVRTYGVVPLNEECGLIEWVPNTQPMRPTILPLYGHPSDGSPELTKAIKAHMDSKLTRLEIFETRLLPMFKPCLFHRWFLSSWPEPYSWLEARQRYVRSTALMSMVGAVIGLGDRHGENILLDSRTGDAVHVDFNCLFWKGKTFQMPERVPFRLTQNMVDALGVLGIEGPFRRSAEVALTVLRANRESLLSVLETFVHDPAVDPTRDAEKDKDNPARAMADIERMLSGRLQEGVVLSVEGQVHQLIEEATSSENLAHMYVGWNAWL
jgi:serine/threonine-protein kinase ATR